MNNVYKYGRSADMGTQLLWDTWKKRIKSYLKQLIEVGITQNEKIYIYICIVLIRTGNYTYLRKI